MHAESTVLGNEVARYFGVRALVKALLDLLTRLNSIVHLSPQSFLYQCRPGAKLYPTIYCIGSVGYSEGLRVVVSLIMDPCL